MHSKVLVGSLGFILSFGAADAWACDFADTPFHTDGSQTGEAPATVTGVTFMVDQAGSEGGCAGVHDSCEDIGSVRLAIPIPSDLDSSPEEIGYEISVEDERGLPRGAIVPQGAIAGFRESEDSAEALVWLRWVKADAEEDDPMNFTIRIVAVDSQGNRSEPSAPIRITDSNESGCNVKALGGRNVTGLWCLIALVGLATRRALRGADSGPMC